MGGEVSEGLCVCLDLSAQINLPLPSGHLREMSTCRTGHFVSSQVPFPGLTESPATNTEHEHIPSYISLSVLAQSPQIQQITNASLPLKDLISIIG